MKKEKEFDKLFEISILSSFGLIFSNGYHTLVLGLIITCCIGIMLGISLGNQFIIKGEEK